MKFDPGLAAYLAVTVAAGAAVYLVYKKLFGSDGKQGLVGDAEDAVLFTPLGNYLSQGTNSAQPNSDYLTARAAWFKEQGLKASDAIKRAEQSDFPTATTWVGNGGYVDFPPY